MLNEFKPVTPELTARNTINDLKTRIRGLEEEMARADNEHRAKRRFLEEKLYEFTNSLDAWNKVLENFKNGGQSI